MTITRQDYITAPAGFPQPPSYLERGDSKMNGPPPSHQQQRYPLPQKQNNTNTTSFSSSSSSNNNSMRSPTPSSGHMRTTSMSSLASTKSLADTSRDQYEKLRFYLADHIVKEKQTGVTTQRNTARERLQRLNKAQFLELFADVFDELTRRTANDPNVPFLPPQEEFQAKRNQARQKFAALPEARFKDLASDIFSNLDKRYPELRDPKMAGDIKRPPLPPMPNIDPAQYPKRSDSTPGANGLTNNTTTIVPTKSTITYEPVDYKIQTGIPSLPPTPHTNPDPNPAAQTTRSTDSLQYENGSPISPSGSPPERNPMNGTNSMSSSRRPSLPRERHEANQFDKSKTPLPRPTMSSGGAPANGTSSMGSINFQSLDNLMADLGSMITTKPNGSQPPSPVAENSENANDIHGANGSAMNGYGDRERELLRDVSQKERDRAAEFEERITKLREDYESRIAGLQKRIAQMESEVETKPNHDLDLHRMRELEDEIAEYKKDNQSQALQLTQIKEQFSRLDDDYRKLDDDYQSQQQVANDVRKEATSLLEEIKELTRRSDEAALEKEQAMERLKVVESECKSWQAKYEKTKTELRNLKATSSFVREPPKVDVLNDNQLRPVPDGAIEQARVIEYQASIDDLLRTGRSDTPSSVLLAMKSIVVSCKLITEDVEAFEARPAADYKPNSKEKLYSLKAKFSSTLTNLMTTAKAHATGMGISPVSLLDAAALHLTVAVVDIVKFVGMRKSRPEDEDRRREDLYRRKGSVASVKSNGNGNGAYGNGVHGDKGGAVPKRNSKRTSLSMGGAWSGKDMDGGGVGGEGGSGYGGKDNTDRDGMEPSELKVYLERQTNSIVQAIQTLLATLRSPSPSNDVASSINTITTTVNNIISTSRGTFALPQSSPYRLRGEAVLRDLDASIGKLSECQYNLKSGHSDTKLAKSKLASVSFEIAKYTKELKELMENL